MSSACSRPRWSSLLLLVAALPAQAPTPAPELLSSALVAQLKANDLSLEVATKLGELLPARPTVVRLQAADALRTQYLTRFEQFTKACEQVHKALTKALPAWQRQQLGRGGEQRLALLRSQSMAVTHRPDLTKANIHDEIDPLVQELRQLLLPDLAALTAEQPSVAEAIAGMRAKHAELSPWHALFAASISDFDLNADADRYFKKKPPPSPPPSTAQLDGWLHDWLFADLPLSARDQKVLADNDALRDSTDVEDFAGTFELNRRRYLLGLGLLRIDPKLGQAARDHSDDMRTHDFFSHTSPVPGKHTFGDRAARAGTSASAENIASGHTSGPSAIDGWWYSPGHHKNMLGDHARTGLGHSETLWTQMFGG